MANFERTTMMYSLMGKLSRFLARKNQDTLFKYANSLTILAFSLFRVRRSLILSNLDTVFGDKLSKAEKIEMGFASVRSFCLSLLEFLSDLDGNMVDATRVEGGEHLRAAIAQKNGVYILCFHMGNWEIMGGVLAKHFASPHSAVKKVGGGGINRYIVERRREKGWICFDRKKKGDAYRRMKEVLAAGEIVGFVMDQARPGEPRYPFFGKPAKTNTSFAAIWAKLPAPVIPAYIIREAPGKHVLKILPPVEIMKSENAEEDIKNHSELFNRVIEKVILECPEQYFWLHDRWK